MEGVWHEFLWDKTHAQNYSLKCSDFVIVPNYMKNKDVVPIVAYNNMFMKGEKYTEELEDYSLTVKFAWNWDNEDHKGFQRAYARYKRENYEYAEFMFHDFPIPEVGITFVDTDYYNYAVGSSCLETDDQHDEGFFVWFRDKYPSMYMKKKARDALLAMDVVPEDMIATPVEDCIAVPGDVKIHVNKRTFKE